MTLLDQPGQSAMIPTAKANDEITVTLRWQKSGLLNRVLYGAVDLDLGCFCETAAGKRLLIDCLQFGKDGGGPHDQQTRQGCYTQPPYIWHSGDNPGVDTVAEETLFINPAGLAELSSITVYAYIYDGPARWHAIDTTVIVHVPGSADDVAIKFDQSTTQRFVAVARIDILPDALKVTNLTTFHDGHADCDRAYGWGFKYYSE